MSVTVYRIGWHRGNAVDGPPEAVQVEQVGWPHLDVDGQKQFENTHFATEAGAWDALLTSLKACQTGSERDLWSWLSRSGSVVN